ncbi:alpha/beta hydrolase [Mycolicibacterium sp. 050158]|uniref:alpha/beta hydrolase n=1 Tax=Mycolicibacterium sp. 050158 TaxID=3090602 RepID=UPI00299E93F8|nr:alpha/beta hydrolase [Mycolicibacterium sp. 050158]MDX1890646.1 alpha/beta hydrolase [Mycolicibacterium sp. 050158]
MTVDLRGVTVVLLPGTGSDDDYVYRAFAGPLHDAGAVVVTPTPEPAQLVAGYRHALDDAARSGPIAVGGVSIGAAVATSWALAHPTKALAVLAALPAWTGAPDDATAALAARYSAQALRRDGLASAIGQMRQSSPAWLAAELTRSWVGQWPDLPEAMESAADYVAPTTEELETLAVPMGIAAAIDDPVHPIEVAFEWVSAAPRAALQTFTLDELGADPAVLGAACVQALLGL